MPQAGDGAPAPSSIISEAVPSEIADFTETRLQGADTGAAPLGAGLPLIGDRPAAEQQRILLAMLGLGLVGLIVLTILSFVLGRPRLGPGRRQRPGADAVAAARQVGVAGADRQPDGVPRGQGKRRGAGQQRAQPEERRRPVAAAPSACRTRSTPPLPLVDRAEKNAGIVVAQQKALTEVGQSLRAINRQSVDLLEAAEAILSLKLQRDASPTEVSALGQLVMLTQRIGKSANEFLTAEGVNPEAVVPARART